jgi:DNA-binding MarR family transcriptional regulator
VIDFLLLSVVLLLFVTGGAFCFYYRRLRRLTEEYVRAKTLVSDIVISFNKQVQQQEEKIASVAQKALVSTSRSSRIENKLENQESQIAQINAKLDTHIELKEETPIELATVTQKITEITKTQEELTQKITNLDEKTQKLETQETNIEAVIPIKQDKALAAITPTELSVLEILASEGEKTAPEIKARVNLTREHTARLMKKLYEEGYLERTTGKIPFAYRIKEEMRKILKKPEAKA